MENEIKVPKLTIIMVARNHFEQTEKAIRSLVKYTDPNDVSIIFFDQSTGKDAHDTSGFVQTYCRDNGFRCKYIFSAENVGYITAVNHCYSLVETEFSLTCHNDVEFSKWWLRNMMRKFDENPNVAAVGPVITYALGQQSINYAYQTIGYKVKFLLGLFFMARQKVLNEVKKEFNGDRFWLNPVYGMGDKEELEFCYQIRKLGYDLAIARDVLITHEGEKSFVDLLGSTDKFHDYQTEKLKLLVERLGQDIVDDIYKLEPPEKPVKVLIGIMTRTNYTHTYFMFSLMGIWGATPVAKQLFHIPRGHVEQSRNRIVEEVLKDESYTHLLFIDDDMKFDQDALTKLLTHEVDICTGVAYQRAQPFMICLFKADHENKFIIPTEAIDVGVVPIDAAGGFFFLIKTDVLRKIPKPWFKYGDISLGYNDKEIDGTVGTGIGEDVYFGLKCTLAGFKMYADTDLEIKHIGYEELVGKEQFYKSKEKGFGKEESIVINESK